MNRCRNSARAECFRRTPDRPGVSAQATSSQRREDLFCSVALSAFYQHKKQLEQADKLAEANGAANQNRNTRRLQLLVKIHSIELFIYTYTIYVFL